MPKHITFILLFFWMACFSHPVFADVAQDNYQQQKIDKEPFNQSVWESLRKKVKINEPKPEKKEEDKNFKTPKWTSWELLPETKLIVKWGLFVVLIVLLLLLVLQTLGINPFRKKIKNNTLSFDIETIAEHLDQADLDPYLLEAIKSGNYKLAIRLYYLQIVQRLNYAGKIKWKKHKTNKNYVNEMLPYTDFPIFKELTLIYEKCWFGPELISKNNYEQISPMFLNYVKNITLLE